MRHKLADWIGYFHNVDQYRRTMNDMLNSKHVPLKFEVDRLVWAEANRQIIHIDVIRDKDKGE